MMPLTHAVVAAIIAGYHGGQMDFRNTDERLAYITGKRYRERLHDNGGR